MSEIYNHRAHVKLIGELTIMYLYEYNIRSKHEIFIKKLPHWHLKLSIEQ